MDDRFFLKKITGILLPVLLVISLANGHNGPEGREIPVSSSSAEALDLFLDGREAFEMGRISDATHFMDNAIKLDGSFPLAWLYKAYMADDYDEWLGHIGKASAGIGKMSEGEKMLIKLEALRGSENREERKELVHNLAGLYPDCPRALLILAAAYQEAGDHTRFRDVANKAILADKDSPLAYRTLAASFLLNQPLNFTLAREYILRFVALRPAEAASYIALGDVYRAEFDMSDAVDAYTRAITLDPEAAIAYVKRGYANIYSGNFIKARLDFALARDLYAKESHFACLNTGVLAYLNPGSCLKEMPAGWPKGNPVGITGSVNPANSADHQFCCSVVAIKHGIFAPPNHADIGCNSLSSQLAFESTLPDQESEEACIAFMDGFIAAEKGNFERAESMKNRYAELSGCGTTARKIEVCNYLEGLIKLNQKKYVEALYYYNKCDISNPCVRFDMALAYMGMGDVVQAKDALEYIVKIGFSGYCKPPMADYAAHCLEKLAGLPVQ